MGMGPVGWGPRMEQSTEANPRSRVPQAPKPEVKGVGPGPLEGEEHLRHLRGGLPDSRARVGGTEPGVGWVEGGGTSLQGSESWIRLRGKAGGAASTLLV